MAAITPTGTVPRGIGPLGRKNQGGAPGRKAFDFTFGGVMLATRGFTFGSTTFATGATIDPGACGMGEWMAVLLWEQGYWDWQ